MTDWTAKLVIDRAMAGSSVARIEAGVGAREAGAVNTRTRLSLSVKPTARLDVDRDHPSGIETVRPSAWAVNGT